MFCYAHLRIEYSQISLENPTTPPSGYTGCNDSLINTLSSELYAIPNRQRPRGRETQTPMSFALRCASTLQEYILGAQHSTVSMATESRPVLFLSRHLRSTWEKHAVAGDNRISVVAASPGRWTPRPRCEACLLYTSPSPRDRQKSRMPSSA